MKLGLFTFQFQGVPFDDLLDLARESEIDAIELGVTGHVATPGFEAEVLLQDRQRREEVQRSISRRGMEICALSAVCNPLHPDPDVRSRNLSGLKSAIRLAAQMGVTRVVTGAGCPGESESSRHPTWAVFAEEHLEVLEWQWNQVAEPIWNDLAAYASEHRVRICVEIYAGTLAYNTDSFLRLRSLAGDAIGANLDPGHLFWQGMDPRVVAGELAGCIYYAHAKDTRMDAREVSRNGVIEVRPSTDRSTRSWSFCAMGDGHDAELWSSMVTSLKAAGYDDVWTIEHEDATLDERTALVRNAAFLRQLTSA